MWPFFVKFRGAWIAPRDTWQSQHPNWYCMHPWLSFSHLYRGLQQCCRNKESCFSLWIFPSKNIVMGVHTCDFSKLQEKNVQLVLSEFSFSWEICFQVIFIIMIVVTFGNSNRSTSQRWNCPFSFQIQTKFLISFFLGHLILCYIISSRQNFFAFCAFDVSSMSH